MRVLGGARAELLDPAVGEPCEVLGGPLQRGEHHPAGLVRQRDLDVGPAGERLEQRPLGSGQILEPVGEDRLALPGVEVGGKPFGRVAPEQVAVPAARVGRARRGTRRRGRRGRRRGRPGRAGPTRARRASASSVSAKPRRAGPSARGRSARHCASTLPRSASARWRVGHDRPARIAARCGRRGRRRCRSRRAKRHPHRSSRSRSTRSTSDRFGTIRVGSSSRRAR